MTVILNRYSGTYDKEDKYSVKVDGQVKCKNMTEEGARAFAAKLGGDAGYVDKTAKRSTVSGKSVIEVEEPVNTQKTSVGNVEKKEKKEKKDK